MAQNSVAYSNLRAEMGRAGLGIGDISSGLGMNRDTLSRKLSLKSPLNLNEAFLIQRRFFPDLDVRYLFSESEAPDERGARK